MNDIPSKEAFEKELQNYRNQIDAIDSALFELILRRSDIVQQVGTLKDRHDDTHIKIRPAREAQQLQSIYEKFKDSPFPEASALMIWRHIINGSLMIENPMRVVTMESPQALPDFAREYFGCYADIAYLPNLEAVLTELREDHADVGIMPMPVSSDSHPWWLNLVAADNKLKLFLKFPFLPTDCVRDGAEAIAISKVAVEAPDLSSHTAMILHVTKEVAPMTLKRAVASVFKDVIWHCSSKLTDQSLASFISVPYAVEYDDERVTTVLKKFNAEDSRMAVVGHFAKALGGNQ